GARAARPFHAELAAHPGRGRPPARLHARLALPDARTGVLLDLEHHVPALARGDDHAASVTLLGLDVEVAHLHVLGRVRQRVVDPQDVQAHPDVGRVHVPVVVVRRPGAGDAAVVLRVRAALEEADLLDVVGVGEVEEGHAALVPGLHHDVLARDRHQRAVVGDAVLGLLLVTRDLEVAALLQLAVHDVVHGVRALGGGDLRDAGGGGAAA